MEFDILGKQLERMNVE